MISVISLTVFSVLIAVVYGDMFTYLYPSIKIDGGLITLFAFLGIATYIIFLIVWKILVRLLAHPNIK